MTRDEIKEAHPEIILIDELSSADLAAYLRETLDLPPATRVAVSVLNEGNMNISRKLHYGDSVYVIKQSVPWVAKYPQIEAPWDRAIREASFYQATSGNALVQAHMPALLATDLSNRILVYAFVPDSHDGSTLYTEPELIQPHHWKQLAQFLAALHGVEIDAAVSPMLTNRDMRALNYAHVFDLPFRPETDFGLDAICDGLQGLADKIKSDGKLHKIITGIGEEIYLKDGATLIHGDFFPGCFLLEEEKAWVIDAEFGFRGHAVFDLAVLHAHLTIADIGLEAFEAFSNAYRTAGGQDFDTNLMLRISAVEILRRVIGVAQLPAPMNLARRTELVKDAVATLSPAYG